MTARIYILIAASLAVFGCAVQTTQRDRDVAACTYGAIVPHNVDQRHRAEYINDSVAGCLKAKGYKEAKP